MIACPAAASLAHLPSRPLPAVPNLLDGACRTLFSTPLPQKGYKKVQE